MSRDHICNSNLKSGSVVIKKGQNGKPDKVASTQQEVIDIHSETQETLDELNKKHPESIDA